MLGDPRHEVVFVGYQAKGTPGAVIQACKGAQGFVQVDLGGRMYGIQVEVTSLGGYSAHADQDGLVAFASVSARATVILVHGEAGAKAALASTLRQHAVSKGISVEVEIP